MRIVLRPLGSALPLGFAGFGIGIAIATAFDAHVIPASEQHVAAVMMLGFPVPLEAIAMIFALLSRDGAAATAMGIFAASWIVNGTLLLLVPGNSPSPAVGVFTAMMALYVAGIAALSAVGKPLLFVFLVVATARMIAYACVQFSLGPIALAASNLCGAVLVVASLYGMFGFLLEDAHKRELLPLFRRGKAQRAVTGDFDAQVERIEHEAGVRSQL